jgi:hypothetical protein
VETLSEYNVPLAGLIEEKGRTYLYVCLLGELEPVNIWAYCSLSGPDVEHLRASRDDDLSAAIDETLSSRSTLLVAFAADYELVRWLTIDAGVDHPLELAKRFISQLRRRPEALTADGAWALEELHEMASASAA